VCPCDKKYYFFVEGATGVGKTTFVRLLEENMPEATIVYEPVDTFTNVNGAGNILELMFGNPKRWAFTAEIYFALMHTKAVELAAQRSEKEIMIIDTSIYADYHVFTRMMYELGNMNKIELAIYQEFFNWLTYKSDIKASGFIYLEASPKVALERVEVRNRTGEQNVDLYYQELNVPVLTIDARLNFKDDLTVQQQYVNQVKAFIKQHTTSS
jgi:deoxyadenosine/deoxycytidine kinase